MARDVLLKIAPIGCAARQGKLISLDWACEREGLSFPLILRCIQENPDELQIYQDAPNGALLVGSADIASFATRARYWRELEFASIVEASLIERGVK